MAGVGFPPCGVPQTLGGCRGRGKWVCGVTLRRRAPVQITVGVPCVRPTPVLPLSEAAAAAAAMDAMV